jgi:hypothetical protein
VRQVLSPSRLAIGAAGQWLWPGRISLALVIRPSLSTPHRSGVALEQGQGGVFGLLEGGVRRDGRDVRVGPHVEHRGPAGGQGLVPGRPDLAGVADRDPVQAQAAGEAFVGDIGEPLVRRGIICCPPLPALPRTTLSRWAKPVLPARIR